MNNPQPGQSRQEKDVEPAEGGRSVAEWTTLAASLIILVALFGLVTWFEVRGPDNPPRIAIEVDMVHLRHDAGYFYVDAIIRNDGDETVEALIVEATLDTGTGEPEVGQITIDFLAGGESADGTFAFESDPATGELTVRPVSFTHP